MLLVKPIRQRAGLSQEGLAEAAAISVWTVRRIENQSDYEPGVLAAHRIAKALGVSLDDLVHDDDSTAPRGTRRDVPGSTGAAEGSGRKSPQTPGPPPPRPGKSMGRRGPR